MSVDQARTIDFIGVDKSTGDLILTVSDHLDWKDSGKHQLLLQAKINSYLSSLRAARFSKVILTQRGGALS
jgi:uncharacterized protein DUF6572